MFGLNIRSHVLKGTTLKLFLKFVLKKVPKKNLCVIHEVFLNSRIVRRCVLRMMNPNIS